MVSLLEFHSIKKGYLVYVPQKQIIVSLYDVVSDEIFSSALEYTLQPYSEAIAMQTDVS